MPWRADLPRGAWLAPAAAAAVRLAVLAADPSAPETFEYDELARNVLAGRGYVHEHNGAAYRGYSSGLVYTALTIAAYALGGVGPLLMRGLQVAIAAASSAVAVGLAHELGARGRRAVAAGLLVAVHPALVYYDVRKLHPLGLDALLPLAFVAAVLASRRGGTWASAGCGLILGAGVLERLTLLPMLAIGAFWIAGRRPWPRVAAFVAAALLVVAPWLVRNHAVFGVPLLSTMTPEYFFMGNVPPSLGSYHLPSGGLTLAAAPPAFLERLASADEHGQARLFREASLEFVRGEPVRFAAGVGRKIAYFWTWAPQTGVLYPARYRQTYLALYVVLLVSAAAGAIRLWRASPETRHGVGLMLALAACVSLLQAVLYFELRHRWALEPLMMVLAVFALPATSVPRARARARRNDGTGRRSDADDLR